MCFYLSRHWLATSVLYFAILPLATFAYDPSQRSCVGDNICLTSFHWCAVFDLNDDGQTGCSFPDGAYPMAIKDNLQNAALLFRNMDYVISWKKGDPTNENPVKITWEFGSGVGFDDRAGLEGINVTRGPKWETNVTGTSSSFTFRPGAILGQFPTEFAPNMSSQVAGWLTAQDTINQIVISQPRRYVSGNAEAVSEDRSQLFVVVPAKMKYFLAAQKAIGRDEMYNKWKLGVGVGVGVGVPLLLLVSAFLGWFMRKKVAPREPEEIHLASK